MLECKRFSKRNLQNETKTKYFLLKDGYDKHKMLTSDQTEISNTLIVVNKSFDDKQTVLDLSELFYENSISPEQSSEVVEDLSKIRRIKYKMKTLIIERKLSKIRNWQDEKNN